MMIRLTLRTADGGMSWTVDEWTVFVALAALSAEPESMAEFFDAVRRYQPNHRWDETGQAADQGSCTPEHESWCLIDLDSQSVVAGGEFTLPKRGASFRAVDNEQGDGFSIVWIDAPRSWSFQPGGDDWRSAIAERRETLERHKRIASRAILYGRPMLEFVGNSVLAKVEKEPGDKHRYAAIREIHVAWLMTERQDLLGHSPRHPLLRHREHIDLEINHRSEQWSIQGFAPPALNVNSAAYEFAGYGTSEVALYFDLIRSVLEEAWERVVEGESSCELLIEWLAEHLDQWLDQPLEDESGGQSCNDLIESERRRMPVVSDDSHLDCDCPICRAQAEGAFGTGPTFIFSDGHHLELEDEFAFSLTESHEEWEREQIGFRDYGTELYPPVQGQRKTRNDEPESVWKSSSVDWDNVLRTDFPPLLAKLAIGFPLAELVFELQKRGADSTLTDALNTTFGTFRRADDPVAEQSAAEGLRACLEQLAETHPELMARSADLQSRLDEVLRSAERST